MLPWIRSNKQVIKKVTIFCSGLFLVAFFIFCFSGTALAQGDTFGVNRVGENLPLGGEDIRVIIAKIIRIALGFLGIIAVSIILYAGFVWMTSGGNEEKIGTAKKILINASIGLAIILASFSIVQFILNALQQATGGINDRGGAPRVLNFDSYFASGALGRIVQDHYPFRDQQDVKRNSRIVVTFREAIEPSSIINNTNGNNIIGDCINVNDQNFNWGPAFCDQLNTSSVKIFQTNATSSPAIEAAALTVLEGAAQDAFSFVFRPLGLLGSDQIEVSYTVDLTKNILKKNSDVSAFAGDRHGHYLWKFRTDTLIDVHPPHVVSVFPQAATTEFKNSVVQINFNEPMDPTVVQGSSRAGSLFSNIIFGSEAVRGNWQVTNGYKTVEFLSEEACGQNSCGETMYCLPVVCEAGQNNCTNPYEVLIRSALTFNENSFESVPLSGVADMAGNALDNGPDNAPDGVVNRRPGVAAGQERVIGEQEKVPDNYAWAFRVSSTLDRSAPYITKVTPNLDQEGVDASATATVTFSKRMQMSTLREIALEEYPHPEDLVAENPVFRNLGDIWFRPTAEVVDAKTVVDLWHRDFGPEGTNFYYFPIIPSQVRSITQNCLYPGRGPFGLDRPQGEISPECEYIEDDAGNVVRSLNCLDFRANFSSSTDTGCVQYSNQNAPQRLSSTSTCVEFLKREDISPEQRIDQ